MVVIHLRLTSLSCSIAVDVADGITITLLVVAVRITDSICRGSCLERIFAGGPAWSLLYYLPYSCTL